MARHAHFGCYGIPVGEIDFYDYREHLHIRVLGAHFHVVGVRVHNWKFRFAFFRLIDNGTKAKNYRNINQSVHYGGDREGHFRWPNKGHRNYRAKQGFIDAQLFEDGSEEAFLRLDICRNSNCST